MHGDAEKMRENKFRVWCVNKQEWEKHPCYLDTNGNLFQIANGNLVICSPQTHIVEFFVGVKDNNKKEIYEGDIVKYKNHFGNEYTYTIQHESSEMMNSGRFDAVIMHSVFYIPKDCIIIGNKHEGVKC